jgi:hypothetical protein
VKRPPLALLAAALVFVALAWLMQARVFAFAEELMLHTTAHASAVATTQPPTGPLAFDPACDDAAPPRALVSPARRPNLSLCSGGRRYPLLVASYMSGWLYWPLALLAPLHHDNLLRLRVFSIALGLVDLVLTWLVLRRLRGDAFAGAAAVAIAVTPVFSVTHTALVHFETLPWTFLMAAALSLLDCRALWKAEPRETRETRVPSSRLLLAAFLLGLAVAANFKAVFAVFPAALVALRLGATVRRIRPAQWAGAVVAGLAPLAPMLWFTAAHPEMFLKGDKTGGMFQTLAKNLLRPAHLAETTRDMLAFWSNFGAYFDPSGSARWNVPALVLAAASFLVVLAVAARALWRGQGCPVTAATAAILVAHLFMLALLVDTYPVNFTPCHTAFGLTVACAAWQLYRLPALARWKLPPLPALAALTAALALPFALATVQTGTQLYSIPAPFNLHAERELIAHLDRVDPHDGKIHTVSTEDLMTGVVESLSEGRVRVAQAQDYLAGCHHRYRGEGSDALVKTCLAVRFRRVVEGLRSDKPLRFVLPADIAALRNDKGEPEALVLAAALQAGARDLGLGAETEAQFVTAAGVPAIVVVRVDP